MMKTVYRIIIAGGRNFSDYELLRKEALAAIYRTFGKIDKNNVTIVSGHAKGADALGERFAKEFELNTKIMPADWEKYDKRAGYVRNEQMALFTKGCYDEKETDDIEVKGMLIAFWDGESRGTKHMIEIAKNKKMPVVVIKY
jgi:hypothetical protein